MNRIISQHLRELYGEASAANILLRLREMLDQHRLECASSAMAPRTTLNLTQRDVLLITYADQVHEPGRTPLKTLADFCARHLINIVSGIHLLPFYPSSSDDGFSVQDYFNVEPACGSWDDIAQIRDGFDLMFDGVFNHVSAQGLWFQRFLAGDPRYLGFFITVDGNPDLSQVVRPRALPLLTEFPTASGVKKVWTTFSADQVDLNFKNPEVLLAVLKALLFYVEHGAKYIRLDAIAFLWKEPGSSCLHLPQTHAVIQLMRAILDDVAPDVLLVTETNVPHRDNISYFGDGANEAQLVYNFTLPPLLLHTFQTGSAAKLVQWAQSLVIPCQCGTFFNFLASHDGIGLNPVRDILNKAEIQSMVDRTVANGGFISYKDMADGTRLPYEMNINYFDALMDPAGTEPVELAARKFLAAHAILLCLQGVPGIYFHSMFGSRGDRAGAEASGIPRRINREKLDRIQLEMELGATGSLRRIVWSGIQQLLRIRRAMVAFHPQANQRIIAADPRVFAVLRIPPDDKAPVLCLHNISCRSVAVSGLLAELKFAEDCIDLLTGRCYIQSQSDKALHELEAFQTLWLQLAQPLRIHSHVAL